MKRKQLTLLVSIGMVLLLGVGATYVMAKTKKSSTTANTTIDVTKLPLGDKKTTSTPKVGYVYACQKNFNGGGAFQIGPWVNQSAKTWDLTKKITVDGAVTWANPKWSVTDSGANRVLTTNGYPSHTTGVYPVARTDDAYTYDRNPNSIKQQNIVVTLPANPTLLSQPECVGGEVGIMLTGIPLFNSFDAAGRDAVAIEIQDDCSGHPQSSGLYHYHGPSKCLKDTSKSTQHSDLVGYAFDGFGIYGTKGEKGVELASKDLDECHGHTHSITWDGKKKSMYHYHLTQDFPYSVSCMRGKKAVNGPLGSRTH